jgi:hypothetical protein
MDRTTFIVDAQLVTPSAGLAPLRTYQHKCTTALMIDGTSLVAFRIDVSGVVLPDPAQERGVVDPLLPGKRGGVTTRFRYSCRNSLGNC